MVLIAYARMGTRSRRAMRRAKTRRGQTYFYRPRITLVNRLAQELGMNREQVLDQIQKEREILLNQQT